MSAARPEFGPSLPELAGPRLRRLPRAARAALVALAALVLVALLWFVLTRGDDRPVVVITDTPVPYNFTYDEPLRRTAAPPPADVALTADGLRFSVAPMTLPRYEGDSSGTLPILTTALAAAMEDRYEDFVVRQEGRANINRQQGYELFFQFRRDGETWYGRRVLLLPETTDRRGADILLEARRSARIPKFSSLGSNGALKVPLRSFRFGTERP